MSEINLGVCGLICNLDGEAVWVGCDLDSSPEIESMKIALYADSMADIGECVGFNNVNLIPVNEDNMELLKERMKVEVEIINGRNKPVYSIWNISCKIDGLGDNIPAFAYQMEMDDAQMIIMPTSSEYAFDEFPMEINCYMQPFTNDGEYDEADLIDVLCCFD